MSFIEVLIWIPILAFVSLYIYSIVWHNRCVEEDRKRINKDSAFNA